MSLYEEYVSRDTVTNVSKEEMSIRDNPTVTVCFYSKQSIDFENGFHGFFENINMDSTRQGTGRIITKNGTLDTTLIRSLYALSENGFKRHCFLIRKWKTTLQGIPRVENDFVRLYFKFKGPIENNVTKATVYFTSEENAYGAVSQKWLDGDVTWSQFSWPLSMKGKRVMITVTSMVEFNYLGELCSKQAYYDCLASKLTDTGEKESHQGADIGEVVSLPQTAFSGKNFDTNNITRLCELPS